VTSWDVAREAGVSQSTVSRVLTGDSRVADGTRKRVIDRIERLGYTPNAVARGLATSRSNLVAVAVTNILNPFYHELLETIDLKLSERGHQMILSNVGNKPAEAYIQDLVEQRVAGIIFATAPLQSPIVARLARQHFPLVLVNRYVDDVACDVVTGDNHQGGQIAAEHLLELGHQRIALVAGNPETSTNRDRLQGFEDALARAGVEFDTDLLLPGDSLYDRAFSEVLELLRRKDRPSAIFCANDLMALATLNAARTAGVDVPKQLSVIGFDDVVVSSWPLIQLTTIRIPTADMARAAVELLGRRMKHPRTRSRRLVFPSRLVRRQTTGPAPRARSGGPAKKRPDHRRVGDAALPTDR
jgi:LacI family transcriptional regulator